MNIVYKFRKVGELVRDTCTGFLLSAESCSNLPEYSSFLGCGKNGICVIAFLPSVAAVYTKQGFELGVKGSKKRRIG